MTVKCPACVAALVIPRPSDSDLFDELSNLEAAANQARLASRSDVGSSLTSAARGAGLGGASLSMGKSRSNSIPLPAIIAGGVIALACLVLVVFLVAGGSDSQNDPNKRNVAKSDSSVSQTESQHDANQMRSTTPSSPAPADQATPPSEPAPAKQGASNGTSDGDAAAGSARPNTPPKSSSTNSADDVKDTSPDAKYIATKLRTGATKWHAESEKLIASRLIGDDDILEYQYGWMVELLPHIGHQADYDKLNFEKKWREKPNAEIAAKVFKEFLNPADSIVKFEGAYYGGMGVSHFVGMSGVEDLEKDGRNFVAAVLPRKDPRAGIFGYTEIAKPNDITDGSSKTIMLIGAGENRAPWISAGGSTVRGLRLSKTASWADKRTGLGSIGHKKEGAIVMMADGSVRWINADIDTNLLSAMCTTHGSDSVDLSKVAHWDPPESIRTRPSGPPNHFDVPRGGAEREAPPRSVTLSNEEWRADSAPTDPLNRWFSPIDLE